MGKGFNELLRSDPGKSIIITKKDLDCYFADPEGFPAWVIIKDPNIPTPKRPLVYQVTPNQFEKIVQYIRKCLTSK